MSPNEDHTQLFARICLHGLTKSSNGSPCSIDLERRTSFPTAVDYVKPMLKNRSFNPNDNDLSPRSLTPRYEVEARVCFDHPIVPEQDEENDSECCPRGALGDGRSGIVYPLEILSIKPSTSQASVNERLLPSDGLPPDSEEPLEPPTLPPLCIKVAIPHYARNLARDAWFYERLDAKGLTGLVTPCCYGVFPASNIPDELTVDIPGYDYYKNASTPNMDGSELYTACMTEEYWNEETRTLCIRPIYFMDDMKKSYANSEWTQFRETPEVTTMTVLIMDMLGARLTIEDFERDWEGELNDIYDHLLPLEFVHDDLRFPNVLQVPPHLQVLCPMHPNAIPGHRWNFIDWEKGRIQGDLSTSSTWTQRCDLFFYYVGQGGLTREFKYRHVPNKRPKRRKVAGKKVGTVGSETVSECSSVQAQDSTSTSKIASIEPPVTQ